ncbi:MAG TPA: sigma-54 dependent transcriptional regulator [Vicinamibacteria bacterium]|nr:sigma-54 dependent transcriptional regulator [Vicinamibacteria bacterium]HRB14031.1 sigma-54 dependent transcriptional regulator [Vicinamibacteria bacterium]
MSEPNAPTSEGRILVIDDEPSLLHVLELGLSRAGFFVGTAASYTEALARLEDRWDLVVTDLQLPDGDGLSILRQVKEASPETAVMVLTAHGSADTAVAAMKLGAHDYLTKPFDIDELRIRARQAIEGENLRRENRELRAQVGARAGIQGLIGKSASMRAVVDRIRAVSSSSSTVLIVGESGTGKELVARAIHDLSQRKGRPFVAINCGAIAESLLESEMFGHVKGAFTDARQSRAGVIEQAHQGTLLLDEIGEMSLSMQVKLLRVIQERRVRRVGGVDETPVDVRIIASTHRDLNQMVREGSFREDLYYRIDVIQVLLPPLRERLDDIPLLVAEFSSRLFRQGGFPRRTFSPAAMAAFMRHPWPGNVRELENVVERALTLATDDTVGPDDLSLASPTRDQAIPDPYPGFSLQDYLNRTELHLVRRAMEIAGDRRPEAAKLLGVSARALKYLLSKLPAE